MKINNVPVIDNRYWVAILTASLLGTTLGDYLAHGINLGFTGGLLPLAVLFIVVYIAEQRAKISSEAYYWTEIVLTRTAATNIGDFLTHELKLGNGKVAAALAVAFVFFFLISRNRTSNDAVGKVKRLPLTNLRYWALILLASTIGTTAGDFTADDLGFGVGKASLILGCLLVGFLIIESKISTPSEGRYWAEIILIRTLGTTMGDFLTGDEGLNLGFGWGAATVGVLLVVILLTWPSNRGTKVRPEEN